MAKEVQLDREKIAVTMASIAILTFLGFQLYTAHHFRDFWPKFRRLQSLHKLLDPPKSPALWPFMDYPMYSYPKYLGNGINQYFIFGTLAEGGEVRILPEDLGIDYWVFMYGFKDSLRQENYEDIKNFAKLYEEKNNKKLIAIRLEDRPLVLSKDGVKPGETEIVKNFQIEELKDRK